MIGYEYFDKVVSGNYSVQKIDKVNFPGKKNPLNLCIFRFLTHILDSLGAKVKERLQKADLTAEKNLEKDEEDEEDEDDEDDEDNNYKEKTKKKTKKVKRLYTKSEDKKVFLYC